MASLITRQTAGANCTVQGTPLTNTTIDNNLISLNNELVATVHSVTGTAPVVSSGGTTPAISMAAATASVNGYMTSAYATKLDGVATGATANLGTITSVTGTAPVVSSGGTTPAISMAAATASVNGYMTSTFASKLNGIPAGAATATVNGYMTSTYASKLDGIAAGATNISNTNQLTNGAGYITASGSCNYATSASSASYATSATTASYANGSQQGAFVISATSGDGAIIVTNSRSVAGSCYIDMHQGVAGANRLRMLKLTANFLITNDSSSGVYLGVGGTAWVGASDERLKNIDRPITGAISMVSSLRTVIGSYKTDEIGKERVFIIAQDVQKVLPQAISIDDDGMLGVAYTDLIPLLIAAIKEQQVMIKALSDRIEVLENK